MMNTREFYKWLYEVLGPSHEYPRAIQRCIYEHRHLNNTQRFKLVVFFMVNGVDPAIFVPWMLSRFNFDADAKRHILYLVRVYPQRNWKAWNVALKKTTG